MEDQKLEAQTLATRIERLEKQNRRMKQIVVAVIIVAASLLFVPFPVFAQNRVMADQAACAKLVKANMETTKRESPDVYKTVAAYLFEYSPKSHSCVMIINYKAKGSDGKPAIQVLAINAVTMQPMSGYKDIFLIPAGNKQEIMDATNFLFDKWSK
jgi:hypothetical protein